MEEQEGAVNFKFGVLYAKAGQKTDDEMFSNGKAQPYLLMIVIAINTFCLVLLYFTVVCLFLKNPAVPSLTNFWTYLVKG